MRRGRGADQRGRRRGTEGKRMPAAATVTVTVTVEKRERDGDGDKKRMEITEARRANDVMEARESERATIACYPPPLLH